MQRQSDDDPRPTPSMAQYIEIKAANPDCLLFYQIGDFYELFFDDAEIASRALGIQLTKRGKYLGQDVPLAGVPVAKADDYLQRLIALGHRVAVCEQLESSAETKKRGPKAVVRRDVVRLVTPGTITEDNLLEPARASWLAAIARRKTGGGKWIYAVAAADISTGRFCLSEVAGAALGDELARLDAREIVLGDTVREDPDLSALWAETRASLTPLPHGGLDAASAERVLKDYFHVVALDAFGDFNRTEITAAGNVLNYIERTQKSAKALLGPPGRVAVSDTLAIDPATRLNLELTRTLAGERTGSLLAAIDRTVTPGGGRLLFERLSGPSTDPAMIDRRLDAVAFCLDSDVRAILRKALAQAPDMARALTRVHMGRGGPRDLALLQGGLQAAGAIGRILADQAALPPELEEASKPLLGLDPAVAERLGAALATELPLLARDGGFVRESFLPELDDMRELERDSRRVIAAYQARYAEETDCRVLRIKHNHMLGYFIEVPQAVGETILHKLKERFVHRQTMAGAMRFSSPELSELESKIASAGAKALEMELTVFDDLRNQVLAISDAVLAAAEALARIDVAAAFAELASTGEWTRPKVDGGCAFRILGGRHPVVEAALKARGEAFIPNDSDLTPPSGAGGRIALITGPNMGGKSTYLRQNALILVLAQTGSFVPASQAHLGVADRLFSRVGAADDLARGRSTFMVEMVETATILNQASQHSLVILDEIGRGTSTFDGLSIAFASIEHLHDVNRCRALFATHFHELTGLADRLERVGNFTLRVKEWKGDVVFLHEIAPGVADRSYGLQVAKLAGLPPKVVARARQVLNELENSRSEKGRPKGVAELPLFAAAQPDPSPVDEKDALRESLALIEPDDLTPKQGLEELYRLKALLRKE